MSFLVTLYLVAFAFAFLLVLGNYSLFGMKEVMGTRWTDPLERGMRRNLAFLFPAIVLFLGFAVFAPRILSFALHSAPETPFRKVWLSFPLFLIRALLYFGVWLYSRARLLRSRTPFGAALLLLVLSTGSLAIFDWILIFQAPWYSTIFGLTLLMSGLILAYNLALIPALRDSKSDISEALLVDWNTLQLTFIAVWTYLELMQWITIWSANLPLESEFYVIRSHGLWLTLIVILGVFQSAIPIVLLMVRRLKKSRTFTQSLSAACILLQVIFLVWIYAPALVKRSGS